MPTPFNGGGLRAALGLIPAVERLSPPPQCVACGVTAQVIVDATSVCWRHYSGQYERAAAARRAAEARRRLEGADA